MRNYRVVVIPGDGIGPELTECALRVLDAVVKSDGGFRLTFEQHSAGARHYVETGRNMDPETLQACRDANAVLKAPVGLYEVRFPDGTEAGLLGGVLRNGLDLYANVRPIKLWPGVEGQLRNARAGQIDYVIVRENTEGLYLSRGKGVVNHWAASDIMMMTRPGVERVCRFAFDLARKRGGAPRDGVKRVTCVDKSNVLRSMWFFREIFTEIGAAYPEIEKDFLYSDAAAQALVMHPGRFDVLVMENFLGDLLSDLGGATVGGLGICPSGNLGDKASYFEPIHGSAPDIAGKGVANPMSMVLSAAMMLDHLGEQQAAQRIEGAVWKALEGGRLVIQGNGQPVGGSRAATEAILAGL